MLLPADHSVHCLPSCRNLLCLVNLADNKSTASLLDLVVVVSRRSTKCDTISVFVARQITGVSGQEALFVSVNAVSLGFGHEKDVFGGR